MKLTTTARVITPGIFMLIFLILRCPATAQVGYIYAHLKHVSEQNSPDYSFVLKNSSGVTISSFFLNDKETADNSATSSNFLNVYDLGVSHGTGGDGQLWAIAGTSFQNPASAGAVGTVYNRPAGSTNWTAISFITNAIAIDGAYQNQFVYIDNTGTGGTQGKVIFYNNGTSTTIYTSTNATDVTANGGNIAIVAGGFIYLYNKPYSSGTAPVSGGTWNSVVAVNAGARLDMNLAGNKIAFILGASNTVKTVPAVAASTATALTSPGIGVTNSGYVDIAYDDNGNIYATANISAGNDLIYSYNGTSWTGEAQSRLVARVSAGVAKSVYGIPANYNGYPASESIWSRQTDNNGSIYWIDDDRVKKTSALNGNGIFIPVSPGTYTLTETVPSGYDLGRINLYDPGGDTTTSSKYNVNTNTITYVVSAAEVVFGEYVNESLVPKVIALTCSGQTLQTFDATTSTGTKTYTYGSGTYGSPVEGTSYHYWTDTTHPQYTPDGYYILEKVGTGWTNSSATDHTANGGYFLVVNASYAQDEFYRQRVTNLVPGVTYSIAFWATNMSYTATTIPPNVSYGLQDTLGNIVAVQSTGNFVAGLAWHQYSFSFTATTSRADLFLRNNNIGGNGNDIGIDDISVNPILPTLTIGSSSANECIGSTYNFSYNLTGGVWTSSNKSVATINPGTGIATAVGVGTAVITYNYTSPIGCVAKGNNTIKVGAPATDTLYSTILVASAKTTTTCIGSIDSLFSNITAQSNPLSTYTYSWSASPTTGAGLGTSNIQNTSATPSASGAYNYIINVTDTSGCIGADTVTVTVPNKTAPTVSASAVVTSANCAALATANLNGSISGSLTPNYSYVWGGPGTIAAPSSGSTSATSYNTTASTSVSGNYTLTVTDGNGCVSTATAATPVGGALSVTASSYATKLCSNTKDSLYGVATGGTGAITYAWTSAPTTSVSYSPGAANATTGVSITTAGTYTFTIKATDSKGCTGTATVPITYLATTGPSINAYTAAGVCSGGIFYFPASVVAGTGAVNSYVWNSPSPTGGLYHTTSTTTSKDTAAPTAAGNYVYVLKATDANGCSASATTPVQTVYSPLTVVATSATSAFCGTSTTDQLYSSPSGGSGTYSTYAWTTTVVTTPGTTSLSSTSIANPIATISGAAGTSSFKYNVTVTDNKGCTGTASTTIIPITSAPSVSGVTATPASLCTSPTNTIALSASFSGGTAAYSYAWVPPDNSTVTPSSGTVASAGTLTATATATAAQNYSYSLTVVDANNCVASGSTATVVSLTSAPDVSLTADKYLACSPPSATINLTAAVTGGTGSYTNYAWTGSGLSTATTSTAGNTATPTSSGNYVVTVSDANGCSGTGTTPSIVQTDNPLAVAGYRFCTEAYVELSEYGGSAVSWNWTGPSGVTITGANTQFPDIPNTGSDGTYTVAIVDALGCPASGSLIYSGGPCSVLALNLLNFDAQKTGSKALLKWSVLAENNNGYFEIERSADDINWVSIGRVTTDNTSKSYGFTDVQPLNGTNFYRLQQVNATAGVGYSNIRTLQFGNQWRLAMYPNPVITLTLVKLQSNNVLVRVRLIDINGQTILLKTFDGPAVNTYSLNISSLVQGVYLLQVTNANGEIQNLKLVKSQ